jgi:hypothetical protein
MLLLSQYVPLLEVVANGIIELGDRDAFSDFWRTDLIMGTHKMESGPLIPWTL